MQSLLLCAKDQQRSLGSEAQAKADRALADLKAQLETANRLLSEEQVKFYQESNCRQQLQGQLKDSSQCSLLFYDAVRRVQLRLEATTVLHEDNEVSDRMWAQTNMSARKTYLSAYSPGERLSKPDDGLPGHLNGRDPQPEESEDGRKNFLVIEFRIQSIDWLFLNAQGHRRAKIEYYGDGFDGSWINP